MANQSFTRRLLQVALLALSAFWSNSAKAQAVQTITPDKDFGAVGVKAANPVSAVLQFQVTSFTSAPKFALRYELDFSLGTASCAGSGKMTCTLQVNFSPQRAGLRQDALLVETVSGSLLYTTLLHGVGLGANVSIFPGTINTVAGVPGVWGFAGDRNVASDANFANQQNIAFDAQGNLYIADSLNQVVREIDATTHVIKTIAGTPFKAGFSGDGGLATSARLNSPSGVALDGAGNLYVADYGNNRVRRIDFLSGFISTVAGGEARERGVTASAMAVLRQVVC